MGKGSSGQFTAGARLARQETGLRTMKNQQVQPPPGRYWHKGTAAGNCQLTRSGPAAATFPCRRACRHRRRVRCAPLRHR